MDRLTAIEAAHKTEIRQAARRFGDHEDMTEARVIRWLSQFDDADRDLALKVLRRIKYYATAQIRAKTRELVKIIRAEFPKQRLAYVAVGGAGSGSQTVIRAMRDCLGKQKQNVIALIDLVDVEPNRYDVLVFVDDFSGTGKTLSDWWDSIETLARPAAARFAVALLVLNEKARSKVETFASSVLCVDELGGEYDVFGPTNSWFTENERNRLLDYSSRLGCSASYYRGFGDCGLLVAFKHMCPNNSIPTLWYQKDSWESLFNRRGL